jgi:uncharacterized protein YkwD
MIWQRITVSMMVIVSLGISLGIILIGAIIPTPAHSQEGDDERCFPETGFCISGPIRDYWEQNGGLPVFGYPTTPLGTETVEGSWSGPVQWFERDRLEDHGNEGVMAGRLGADLLNRHGQPWHTFPKVSEAPTGCRFFDVTGHTLCEPFLSYWGNNGGLERFGYPITEPFEMEIGDWSGTVQYFERRRMEHHTENRGTPYEVLLGLLGNEVRAISSPPGESPTPTPMGEQPTPTATEAPPTPTPTPDLGEMVARVVARTNEYRREHGCPDLVLDERLNQAAQAHSTDMALNDIFSHTGSDGSSPWDRIRNTGYPFGGGAENIFGGVLTPEEAVEGWYASEGHRKNMLNCDMVHIGVGYYHLEDDGGSVKYHSYWTQVFAIPMEETPTPTTPADTPTPTPTTPADTPTPTPDTATFAAQVVEYTNEYRREQGCSDLVLEERLTRAAQDHSADMAMNDYFSHTGLNGSTPWDRIKATGYQYSTAAENIYAGATTPEQAVEGWYNSEGHRNNMLNCDMVHIGVGYYKLENDTGNVNYTTYWTQVFASPQE